jgi:hypothetical protein
MLNAEQINEIHRLARGEHWSMRRIARHLHLAARTVKKYCNAPRSFARLETIFLKLNLLSGERL